MKASSQWFKDRRDKRLGVLRNWYRYERHGWHPSDTPEERLARHLEAGIDSEWGSPVLHLSNGEKITVERLGDVHEPGVMYVGTAESEYFDVAVFIAHITSIHWD